MRTKIELENLMLVSLYVPVCVSQFRIQHSYLPMLFGTYYTAFSVIYWAAGGTGRCAERCSPLNATTTTLPPHPGEEDTGWGGQCHEIFNINIVFLLGFIQIVV